MSEVIEKEMMIEPEDELTEQMIAAVQSLKEQFSATLQQINEAHKAEVKEKLKGETVGVSFVTLERKYFEDDK